MEQKLLDVIKTDLNENELKKINGTKIDRNIRNRINKRFIL